jgi:hypothetical protein
VAQTHSRRRRDAPFASRRRRCAWKVVTEVFAQTAGQPPAYLHAAHGISFVLDSAIGLVEREPPTSLNSRRGRASPPWTREEAKVMLARAEQRSAEGFVEPWDEMNEDDDPEPE